MIQRPATSHSQKINQQIRKQLLPRTDKLKQMASLGLVPQSNSSKIIIPCLQKTLGFKTNQYSLNKCYLEGFISRIQFNGFVRKCNKIVQEEVIKKTKKENESFFGIISTLLKISLVIALLTFLLLASIVFFDIEEQTQSTILILAGILLASASMIAVVCPVVLYTSKYQTVNYEQSIKLRLLQLVDNESSKLIEQGRKHLRWQIQRQFFWIQLHIDKDEFEKQIQKQDKIKEDQFSQVSANQFIKKENSQELMQNA